MMRKRGDTFDLGMHEHEVEALTFKTDMLRLSMRILT